MASNTAESEKGADVFKFDDLHRLLSGSPYKPAEPAPTAKHDFPFALDMVSKAAAALEGAEKRMRDTEAWAVAVVKQLHEEISGAEAHLTACRAQLEAKESEIEGLKAALAASEQMTTQARDRLQLAEERAARAEEATKKMEIWLGQVHDVITRSLAAAVNSAERLESANLVTHLESRVAGVATNVTRFSQKAIASIPDRLARAS